MANKPLVSLILPVRDGAAFLPGALESLIAQTFRDFELLVVDDGSHDATPDVISEYAARDPRLRPLANTGSGLVDALNLGLDSAEGDLIARMDHDDRARPGRLAAQVAFLEKHPEVLAVGTQTQPFSDNGSRCRPTRYPLDSGEIRRTMAQVNCLAHPSAVMRRASVLAVGGYRKPFSRAEDYDLWLRLMETGELANLDAIGLDYRLHGGSATIRDAEQQALEAMVARILARYRSRGEPEPGIGDGPLTRTTLRMLGVSERDLARLVRKAWFGGARLAQRIGDVQSRQFCLERVGAKVLPEGGLGDRLDYAWRWLKVRL